jgi:hypothetical protein
MMVLAHTMMSAEDDSDFQAAAGLLAGPIREIRWTPESVQSIVKFAEPALDTPETGCFLPCEVVAATPVGVLFKLIGVDKHIHVDVDAAFRSGAAAGKKYVVVGVVEPKQGVLQSSTPGARPINAGVVNSIFFVTINIIEP